MQPKHHQALAQRLPGPVAAIERSLVVSHVGPIDHNIVGPLIFGKTHPLHHLSFQCQIPVFQPVFPPKKKHFQKTFPKQRAPNVIWKRGSKKLALPKGIVSKPAFVAGSVTPEPQKSLIDKSVVEMSPFSE